jgi:SAM-dependent methyltransferase
MRSALHVDIGPSTSEQIPSQFHQRRPFVAVKSLEARDSPDPVSTRSGAKAPIDSTAKAYDQAGNDYVVYADGDPNRLFSFSGLHAYADRRVWSILEAKLHDLKASGASSVTLLDAGCGPGTWLRRLVTRALMLGFPKITARGFDVAAAQIETARRMARDLASMPGVDLTFAVADLESRMPEADASVDITLCLYSVLSHLRVTSLPGVASELGRVTRGHFIATVRAIGSTPTIFVDSLEKVRHFNHDHTQDRCDIEFSDGRRLSLRSHLFTANELKSCLSGHFDVEDLCGLDLFHTRFTPDRRWNPRCDELSRPIEAHLEKLEELYMRQSEFMDRATHLLFVGRARRLHETRTMRYASGHDTIRLQGSTGCIK